MDKERTKPCHQSLQVLLVCSCYIQRHPNRFIDRPPTRRNRFDLAKVRGSRATCRLSAMANSDSEPARRITVSSTAKSWDVGLDNPVRLISQRLLDIQASSCYELYLE
ncbi:unnamed protein product [Nezara viridula]|uniref:Uncharacterized protein n=1 Tax=Nezara viridula TaxID=85310 RepID=A0A9P0E715_NEZVI|nr:unnamed protein product [Nezara viridula]